MACLLCDDTGWICETCGDRPLKANSDRPGACAEHGAAMPCPICNTHDPPRLPPGITVAIDRKRGPRH